VYSGYELSSTLIPGHREFVVQQYSEGRFEILHRKLVPKHRMSVAAANETLRHLVCRFNGITGLGFEQIVACGLNERGGGPVRDRLLEISTSYPKRGVIRHQCGSNTRAWYDMVVIPAQFRTGMAEA
jgi:hypothetical protein